MTEEGRRKRIREALNALHDKPEPRESLPLFWRGQQQLFPVIELEVDVPLLNTKSHRLRSQLESHPQGDWVLKHPWTDEVQPVVEELLRKPEAEFERMKENLAREGQRQPGVITREGILFNGNRRVVALRDARDPRKSWIRVAVLPEDAEPKELAELELQLQLQEELKVEYSLTNELLFIEELARDFGRTDEQIASPLRWTTKRGAPDAAEVAQRRRILALIRQMQRLVDPVIPLTFFDGKLEQLRALEQRYNAVFQEDSARAQRFRKAWVVTALAGSDSVHDLRAVYDEEFVEEYLMPRLGEQEVLQAHVDSLVAPAPTSPSDLPGVDELDPENGDRGGSNESSRDVGRMIALLSPAAEEQTVTMPDGQILDRVTAQEAIGRATKAAIGDWRQESRKEDRLNEPIAQLREATKHLRKAIASYRELKGKPAFEASRRGNFNYILKQVRKLIKELEDLEKETTPGTR